MLCKRGLSHHAVSLRLSVLPSATLRVIILLRLATDKHKALRGLSATAELLVNYRVDPKNVPNYFSAVEKTQRHR